jgi:histidine triad (HIT) family protein
MPDCEFCSIVAGEAPAHRVAETDRTLAFLDVEPAARGHTLVVPKRHHETMTDAPVSLTGAVFRTVHRVAAALESAYRLDGFNVVQANGATAGQEVSHAHVHVIPRYDDDTVDLGWDGESVEERTRQQTATAIRDELASRT